MAKKKKRNKKRRISFQDKKLQDLASISGIKDESELRKLSDNLRYADKSPRPSLAESVAIAEVYFPKLEQICLEEHELLVSDPVRSQCYCTYDGMGRSYITNRMHDDKFLRYIFRDVPYTARLKMAELLLDQCIISALATTVWKQGKIIYHFDDDLYREVCDMDINDIVKIPIEIFKTIPAWSFYIETPQHQEYEGILCTTYEESLESGKSSIVLNLLGFCKTYKESFYEFTVSLTEVETVGHAIEKLPEVGVVINKGAYMIDRLTSDGFLKIAIPLLLYLCTINADISKLKKASGPKHAKKNTGTVPLQNIFVGERVGAAIRAQKAQYASNTARGGETTINHPVVPHIRSAHIHSYWVGSRKDGRKGDRLIAKWIAPVLVNAQLAQKNGLPTTIRNVKK